MIRHLIYFLHLPTMAFITVWEVFTRFPSIEQVNLRNFPRLVKALFHPAINIKTFAALLTPYSVEVSFSSFSDWKYLLAPIARIAVSEFYTMIAADTWLESNQAHAMILGSKYMSHSWERLYSVVYCSYRAIYTNTIYMGVVPCTFNPGLRIEAERLVDSLHPKDVIQH